MHSVFLVSTAGGDLVGISFMGGMATGTVEESGTMTAEIEVQVATSFVGSVSE